MAPPRLKLKGKRFGRLTVLKLSHLNENSSTYWKCKCDCGNLTVVNGSTLVCGVSKSCGCLRKDALIDRETTHGKSKEKEYIIWGGIKQRCYNKNNKNYKDYGGRGIVMSNEWFNDPAKFLLDMGRAPRGFTIERIENNGPYSKKNCRWVSRKEQSNNTRKNRFVLYKNERKTMTQWIETLGISRTVVYRRLKKGMNIELAFIKGILK